MIRKILDFARRDARNVRKNVISLVVCVGIIVLPCFYAWFNIAASWDPYGNTKNLKVAVANEDEGYSSELMPVSVNMGERIQSDLSQSKSIGYVVTDKADAVEGVRSGRYYAAIVFPKHFTSDMLTVLSPDATKPQVEFYQNEKENSIASIVTDKASTAVKQDVEASFAESVTNVGASVLDDLGKYMTDDQVTAFAAKLDAAISGNADSLTSMATDVRGFSTSLGTAQTMLASSSGSFDGSLASTLDAANLLGKSASGVRDLGSAIQGTTDSFNKTIQSGSSDLEAVGKAIDDAFDATDAQASSLSDGLAKATGIVGKQLAKLQSASDELTRQDQTLASLESTLQQQGLPTDAVHEVRLTIQGLNDRVKKSISEHQELSDALQKSIDHIAQSQTDAATSREELKGMVAKAKDGLGSVSGDFESKLSSSLSGLADSIDSAAGDAGSVSSDLKSTLASVDKTAGSAATALGDMRSSLSDAADGLDRSAKRISDLHSSLSSALNSGDVEKVRKVLSSNPEDLAAFISEPVAMDRTPVFKSDNNGSSMAPFYTTLAIWIGGVILAALVKTNPSERCREELGCSPSESYLGRIVFFVLIGLMQSLLIVGGDLFFLGIQCTHPVLMVLAGLVASLAFVNIIFALTASFGDVGKAIAVVLMVIQVAGSGGSFPKEMLPGFFQAMYPFLPFVHAENAMRAAIFGLCGNDFWVELAVLLAYLAPALLLGLVLRKPIIRLNEWFEHRLEETKLM